MQNSKKKQLMDSIRAMLNQDPDHGHFCQYAGKAYRWDDIDYQTWRPKASAHGRAREFKRTQIFQIGNLKIHF